ncbi:FtsQ-type POTRA domain-containing protein [Nonomuraea phyllanthi]|uniref:FtsQ-type POTRA domain-containing protein n=1 Tax=Nonomuraea phyllanthi TaxID=2219224 RepID=A0A5C4VA84_9ACTN|nr:FtsQ-type POTRA domain-containing protein [Nonomuraea phyllanthi]KAB8188287.1 FtsQ-type POTRA domain-containing protein [Nonomuraea phyllanthi]QFY08374.1 FtsQ-type POTRA domain-containing protein [Nonomuraea phyllanthi]
MKARTAFLVLLTAGVVGSAAWLVFFSPVLGVRSIEIVGNLTVPSEHIKQQAGVAELHPLATVNLADVESRVLGIRQLATAKVDRVWPGTLKIEVVEREPVAAIPAGGKFAIVDKQGVVIEIKPAAPAMLPVLKVGNPAQGDPAMMAALKVIDAVPDALAPKIRQVRADTAEAVTLELSDGRTVVWGGADRPKEKARILTSLLKHERAGVYDVSSPDVVTLK